jgi:HPt (histidine-containing phosphotransfer) domain-containing protein
MIDFFLEDAPKLVEQLQAGLALGDAAAVERAGHSLKGLAANMGAGATKSAAGRLEEAGRARDLSQADRIMDRLRQEMSRLVRALMDYKANAQATAENRS